MAAVEARDVWHWSTNHSQVHEDANLASSPSSTRSNGSSDGNTTTPVPDVIHFNNPFETNGGFSCNPTLSA